MLGPTGKHSGVGGVTLGPVRTLRLVFSPGMLSALSVKQKELLNFDSHLFRFNLKVGLFLSHPWIWDLLLGL